MIEYRKFEIVGGETISVPVGSRGRDWVKSVTVVPNHEYDYVIEIVFDDDSSDTVWATQENIEYWQWRLETQHKMMGLQ